MLWNVLAVAALVVIAIAVGWLARSASLSDSFLQWASENSTSIQALAGGAAPGVVGGGAGTAGGARKGKPRKGVAAGKPRVVPEPAERMRRRDEQVGGVPPLL